jgi:hypothetical protein
MALSLIRRNIISTVIIYLTLVFLFIAAPGQNIKEAHLVCDGSTIAVFPDIRACTNDTGKCHCERPPNQWYSLYLFGLVPVVHTIIGYVLLRGSLITRLLLLNAAVVAGFITETIRGIISDPVVWEALPYVLVFLIRFAIGVSVLFLVIEYASRVAIRSGGAKKQSSLD